MKFKPLKSVGSFRDVKGCKRQSLMSIVYCINTVVYYSETFIYVRYLVVSPFYRSEIDSEWFSPSTVKLLNSSWALSGNLILLIDLPAVVPGSLSQHHREYGAFCFLWFAGAGPGTCIFIWNLCWKPSYGTVMYCLPEEKLEMNIFETLEISILDFRISFKSRRYKLWVSKAPSRCLTN